MDNTNISPVTSEEVMSFAQRMATTLVGYSRQAEELETVKAQVSGYQTELTHLRESNEMANRELGETKQLAESYASDVTALREQLRQAQERVNTLNDIAVQRDSKVSELTQTITRLERESNDWQRQANAFEHDLNEHRTMLAHARDDRDHFLAQYRAAESDKIEAQGKLAKIEEHYRSMFAPPTVEAPTTDTLSAGYPPSKPEPVAVPISESSEAKPVSDHWEPNPDGYRPFKSFGG